jgi:hypothetical protein
MISIPMILPQLMAELEGRTEDDVETLCCMWINKFPNQRINTRKLSQNYVSVTTSNSDEPLNQASRSGSAHSPYSVPYGERNPVTRISCHPIIASTNRQDSKSCHLQSKQSKTSDRRSHHFSHNLPSPNIPSKFLVPKQGTVNKTPANGAKLPLLCCATTWRLGGRATAGQAHKNIQIPSWRQRNRP